MSAVTVFVFDTGHAYATFDSVPRVNAWGQYCVNGVLFDTVTGDVQTGRVATCNLPATTRDILMGVAGDVLGARSCEVISWT